MKRYDRGALEIPLFSTVSISTKDQARARKMIYEEKCNYHFGG
jgi:hypothetical protein